MKFAELLRNISTGRALLIGILAAVFYYFFIFDSGATLKSQIASSQQQIQQLQTQIQDSQHKLDAAMVYKKTAAEVGATINKLLSSIPEKFGMPDLMRIVSNEVKVAGSSLISITPEQPAVSSMASEFEELSLSVDVSGSFLQHMVFLSNLTKVGQILITKKFDFESSPGLRADGPPTIKLHAEIVAYRYRGGDEAAAKKEQTQ